jgi:hypothetical protein
LARLSPQAEHLKRTVKGLCDDQPDDMRLRDHLEGLSRDEAFPGLTWYWGPILYQRNRALFRPLIRNHFSEWTVTKRGRWRRVHWSDHADRMAAWLAQARKNRDVPLVRRLLRWQFAGKGWRLDHAAWSAALEADFKRAPSPAARAIVLDEYDTGFELDEDTAADLYETDPTAAAFILRHLPRGFWGGEKRRPWPRLEKLARVGGDDRLAGGLYRKLTPVKQWQADLRELAGTVQDPQTLDRVLDERHLEGYGLKLGDGLIELLRRRGRDVMPYVRRRLPEVVGGWTGSKARPFVELAEIRGWWDLWAAAIRADRNPKPFNQAVEQLLADTDLTENGRLMRLAALAGVSREWNWPGLGFTRIHPLNDAVAATLYRRYPRLVHGPFKPHVMPVFWQGYPKLLEAAQQAGDEELEDQLASRYASRVRYDIAWQQKKRDAVMETADRLGDSYAALRAEDPQAFARRAARVLTLIPAYAIFSYHQLLKTNKLARLLFVRSFEALLAEPGAVRDLVEGSDIHVQLLAYRVLAQDDPRARDMAVQCQDILLGTLLRPLHRKTRLAAFGALANAARGDAGAAARVLDRARKALRLPDKRYPKEELVGLLGQVLHARPGLQSLEEMPVVYGPSADGNGPGQQEATA